MFCSLSYSVFWYMHHWHTGAGIRMEYSLKWGALDFAGGTVVHISAGCAALAGAMVLKQRRSHISTRKFRRPIFPMY